MDKKGENVGGAADKAQETNRTNECNPTDKPTGPGHDAKYGGEGGKADLDNKANLQNPNQAAKK
jgi:hypothetical protein